MQKKEVQALKDIANKLRIHSIEMTTAAGSGHPTTCLSCAEIMSVLFFKQMIWDPHTPNAKNVDEFILSKGHAAPILYAALAEAGSIEKSKLLTLRQFDSNLEGHPTPRLKWIKTATGSLGQGLAVGAGMAIAQQSEKPLRKTYVLLGDGEMAEGSVWEAMNLAAIRKLNNLVAILDMNRLAQSGPTMHGWDSNTYKKKAEAFRWNALVVDGHSIPALLSAFSKASKSKKPTLIIAKTVKGKGSFVENKEGWHGKPFPLDKCDSEIKKLKKKISGKKFKPENFVTAKPANKSRTVNSIKTTYKQGDKVAVRDAFGNALLKLGKNKSVFAIDGDVGNSTRTNAFSKKYPDRFIQCYIAEQTMAGVSAGLASKGKLPFAATFGAFWTRAHDQIRMANYSRQKIVFVGSHAGVSIGGDGPSQMALEDLSMFRTLFNTVVLYPCDAPSCEQLTAIAATHNGVSYIRTTRGKTPVIYSNNEKFKIGGSKLLLNQKGSKIALLTVGVTVHEALEAAKQLKKHKIPVIVIDMYSIKPLDETRLKSLAENIQSFITIEDHSVDGGLGDAVSSFLSGKAEILKLGIDCMPRSGTPKELRDHYDISARDIVDKVLKLSK